MPELCPGLPQIEDAFSQAVDQSGGSVTDRFEDDGLLILRAVTQKCENIQTGDQLNAGVALMCDGPKIDIHPYIFRQVCRNGAIMPQVIGSESLTRETSEFESVFVLNDVRSVVEQSMSHRVFEQHIDNMKQAMVGPSRVETVLQLLSMSRADHQILRKVVRSFLGRHDRSGYGVMNAVTAVARETTEPRTKWELEKLGGMIPAWLLEQPGVDDASALFPSNRREEFPPIPV